MQQTAPPDTQPRAAPAPRQPRSPPSPRSPSRVSASAEHRTPRPAATAPPAGPVAAAAEPALGPCRITGDAGRADVGGHARPRPATPAPPAGPRPQPDDRLPGRAAARARRCDRLAEFFPQTSRLVPHQLLRPARLPARGPDHRLAADAACRSRAYGIERGSPYEPGYRQLVQDIVAAADPKVDFRAYDLVNVLVTPNAGPLRAGHRPVRDLLRQRRGPDRGRRAARQHVLRLQPPGRRLRLVRARPATASCPTRTAMSSACPTSTPRRAAARSATGTSCPRTGAPTTTCWAGTSGSSAGSTTTRSAARPRPAPPSTR